MQSAMDGLEVSVGASKPRTSHVCSTAIEESFRIDLSGNIWLGRRRGFDEELQRMMQENESVKSR